MTSSVEYEFPGQYDIVMTMTNEERSETVEPWEHLGYFTQEKQREGRYEIKFKYSSRLDRFTYRNPGIVSITNNGNPVQIPKNSTSCLIDGPGKLVITLQNVRMNLGWQYEKTNKHAEDRHLRWEQGPAPELEVRPSSGGSFLARAEKGVLYFQSASESSRTNQTGIVFQDDGIQRLRYKEGKEEKDYRVLYATESKIVYRAETQSSELTFVHHDWHYHHSRLYVTGVVFGVLFTALFCLYCCALMRPKIFPTLDTDDHRKQLKNWSIAFLVIGSLCAGLGGIIESVIEDGRRKNYGRDSDFHVERSV